MSGLDSGAGAPAAGSRWELGGRNVGTLVFQTGRPARADYSAERSSGDRIEAVGGAFDVTSPAGGGTTLLIEIPV